MGELGEALRTLLAPGERFRTVRATFRERVDRRLAVEAARRFAATPEGRRLGLDDEGREPEEGVFETVVRFWMEPPRRIREETERAGRTSVGVQDGPRWWLSVPGGGVHSNEDDLDVGAGIGDDARALLDPAGLAAALVLEVNGRVEAAGRRAFGLRGRRRPGVDLDHELAMLAPGADEYELAVDVERGVLLRAASLLGGREASAIEVLEAAFDEELAPGTFEPPAGERVLPRAARARREVTIEEATRLASFPVWMPASSGWIVAVSHEAAEGGRRAPETVAIRLGREDALHHVTIAERAAGVVDDDEVLGEWEEVDVGGERVLTDRGEGSTTIKVERPGTSVTISSDLPLETLVSVARSLRRVEAG